MNTNAMHTGLGNHHMVGIVMKEVVRRAMLEIRKQRMIFSSTVKIVDYKDGDDLVTSADKAAQVIYLRSIRECFPYAGIIAEEDFARTCDDPMVKRGYPSYYFTVDPLDGTKAYSRRQSHGVATMLALVIGSEVVAATIGDPNTLEIYHSRLGSDHVHRIYDFDTSERLIIDPNRTLKSQYLLMREQPKNVSSQMFDIVMNGTAFRDIEISGGSIGTMFARLWKGEVGAIHLAKVPYMTAWDMCPIICLSEKLGFKFFALKGNNLCDYTYTPQEKTPVDFEIICVHESREEELITAFGL